ncbi:MAG: hypothetical protein JXR83_18060, partial [Deltaproteobacteria bacterium]|nr:hypothetical protein [Deltaproteobacteria bacterium]
MAQPTSIDPVKLNVTLKYRTFEEFETGFAANVGTGVIFLRTHMPKPVGTPVSVQLNLFSGETAMKGIGQVIHVWAEATMPAGHQSGMLVKFMPSDDASGMRIKRILDQHGEGANTQIQAGPKAKATAHIVPPPSEPPKATSPSASGSHDKGFSPGELARSLQEDGLVLVPAKPTTPPVPEPPRPPVPEPPRSSLPEPPRPPPAKPTTSPAEYHWKQPEPQPGKTTAPSAPAADKAQLPSLSSLVADSFRAKPKAPAETETKAPAAAADKPSLPSLADLVASSRPSAPTPASTPPAAETQKAPAATESQTADAAQAVTSETVPPPAPTAEPQSKPEPAAET